MASCVYPTSVRVNGKNEPRPCGYCTPCRSRLMLGWVVRLMSELQRSKTAAFVTYTYDDENLVDLWTVDGPTLHKKDFQDYMKRLRKKHAKLSTEKLKYYACGEYGGFTNRPHYHAIMFNLSSSLLFDGVQGDIWKNGMVRVDECNTATIKYVVKYIMKSHRRNKTSLANEFSLMSKGLGNNLLTSGAIKFYNDHELNYLLRQNGEKWPMARYYKEKIYDRETRDKLAKEALKLVEFQTLDDSKLFEIDLMNKKTVKMHRDERNKI